MRGLSTHLRTVRSSYCGCKDRSRWILCRSKKFPNVTTLSSSEHIFIFQTTKSPAHSVFIAGEGEVLVFAMAENSISCRKQLRPRCKRERDIGARSAAFPTAENPRQNAPLKESLGRGDLVASFGSLLGRGGAAIYDICRRSFPTHHLLNLASEAQPCFVEDVVIQWLTAHQRRRFQSNTIGMSYVDDPLFDQRFMTPSLHMWAISKGAQQRYNVKCHHSLSGFKDRRRRLNSFLHP